MPSLSEFLCDADVLDGDVVVEPSRIARPSDLLIDRYAPRTLAEVEGNAPAIATLRALVAARTDEVVVCHGPSGVGKTTAVRLALAESGMAVETFYASMQPVAELQAGECQPHRSLVVDLRGECGGRPTALLVLDYDALSANEQKVAAACLKRIASSPRVVVVVARAPVSRVQNVCFEPLAPPDVRAHLAWIASCEGVEYDSRQQVECCGDMRSALNAFAMHNAHRAASAAHRTIDAYYAYDALEPIEGGVEACAQLLDAMTDLRVSACDALCHVSTEVASRFVCPHAISHFGKWGQMNQMASHHKGLAREHGVATTDLDLAARIARGKPSHENAVLQLVGLSSRQRRVARHALKKGAADA